MTGTGNAGHRPITSPGAARVSRPVPMTTRAGSRSASAVNSAPPTACGAKPMLNASAVRSADPVWAKISTDRPRSSNWKPSTYMVIPANSTRNSPAANTERYVVRPGGSGRTAAGVVAVMNAMVRAMCRRKYSFVSGRKLVRCGTADRGAQRGPDHEPVRVVAAVGADPGAAPAGQRAAPAGPGGAPPVAAPRPRPVRGAGPRDGPRRDRRAEPSRLGRRLPGSRPGERAHDDRRPARPGPVDTRGPGAARGRGGARPAAADRSPRRAHPDQRPGGRVRRRRADRRLAGATRAGMADAARHLGT